jgi:predicted Zn-dependent protease
VFPLISGSSGRVKFVVTVRATAATDAVNVRQLVSHELGHAIGIVRHSPKQTDLMYGGTLNRDAPSPSDRATLQVLYHTAPDITP